jgi:hypothetical protein
MQLSRTNHISTNYHHHHYFCNYNNFFSCAARPASSIFGHFN